jgi:hypothetical protein
MDGKILIISLAVAVVLFLIVRTISSGRYGELRPNEEVTGAFEAFRTDPGMEYYISGSDVYPNAIIGIDKSLTLETNLWKKRELNVGGMKELVGNMRSRAMEHKPRRRKARRPLPHPSRRKTGSKSLHSLKEDRWGA